MHPTFKRGGRLQVAGGTGLKWLVRVDRNNADEMSRNDGLSSDRPLL